MKLKQKILVASALLGLALAQTVQAQQPVLVAGWDFNDLGASPGGLQSVVSNYGDSYVSPFGPIDGVGASVRGTFLANGTGGSEALPSNPATGVSISASPDLIDRQIDTRSSGITQVLGYIPGADNAMQVAARNTLSPQTFAFQVDTTGVGLTSISLWLAKSAASNLTIDWGFKIGAGPVQSLLTTDLSALAANTYANTTVNLSSIGNNLGLVSIVGAVNSTAAAVFGFRIDNTAVYGVTVAAIPEPSTYALILGVACMGFAALRRRRQQQQLV